MRSGLNIISFDVNYPDNYNRIIMIVLIIMIIIIIIMNRWLPFHTFAGVASSDGNAGL